MSASIDRAAFQVEFDKLGYQWSPSNQDKAFLGWKLAIADREKRAQAAQDHIVGMFDALIDGYRHEHEIPAPRIDGWLVAAEGFRMLLAAPTEAAHPPKEAEPAPQGVQAEPSAIYHGNGTIDCGDSGHHNIELLKMIPAGALLYTRPYLQSELDAGTARAKDITARLNIEDHPATKQAEAPSEPMRAHIEQFATRAGWKMEEGEGAFEFVQRKCYQQGWIDHGTKSRDREDDTSASQDQGPDTGRVSGESGPAAEQHNEHRTGQSGADREHDQRDCRGAGLHGASNLPPQVAQKPDFIYNGERGRDAEDLLDGYNHGTAFYASPVLLRIDRAIEPLTSGEIRALMAKHGIAFTNINTVEALVRDVELEHGRGVANPKARAAHSPASGAGEREALQDLLYAQHARPSCQDGAPHVTRCRCVSCATERASAALAHVPEQVAYTYASTQATNCADCGERKHTPLRVDAMGGYVCLTCIDRKLGTLLGEFGYPEVPEQVAQDKIDAERYRLVRRGQHWSVIDGICNVLRGEQLDAAVDAARTSGEANHG